MARSIDQVLAEVSAKSDPQRQTVLKQIADIPNQVKAEETALGAKQTQAFDEILAGARRRGLGYSGIPVGEQAQYNATDLMPAIARLKTSANDRRSSLETALADIGKQDYSTAYDIYNQDRNFEEQQRQFNSNLAFQREQAAAAQRAAAQQSAALKELYNNANTTKEAKSPLSLQGVSLKSAPQGGKGGYNFSFGNKPISAIGFAQVNGVNPADLLYTMAANGDAYAANAYRDIVTNGGNITPTLANKYSSLFWGTNMLGGQPAPVSNKKSGGGGW